MKAVPSVVISCQQDQGIDSLLQRICGLFQEVHGDGEGAIVMVARQREILQKVNQELDSCSRLIKLNNDVEISVIPLRAALSHLGELTGEVTQEDLLDALFSNFCIGK
ncbi:MAG: hypothetical protein HQL52_20230 [Magnetococcales bacterium]|nr:hypothetical protein [Magnetococcales bacterium]